MSISRLGGISIAPNGTRAIVAGSINNFAASIAAPFSVSSVVESLPLPVGGSQGFGDVTISADSQIAILSGYDSSLPSVIVRAPFTTAGASSAFVPITGAPSQSRTGAARFLPPGPAGTPTPTPTPTPTVTQPRRRHLLRHRLRVVSPRRPV